MNNKDVRDKWRELLTYPISDNVLNFLQQNFSDVVEKSNPDQSELYHIRACITNILSDPIDIYNDVLRIECSQEDVEEIEDGWRAFAKEPYSFIGDTVSDMILADLGKEPIEDKFVGEVIDENTRHTTIPFNSDNASNVKEVSTPTEVDRNKDIVKADEYELETNNNHSSLLGMAKSIGVERVKKE